MEFITSYLSNIDPSVKTLPETVYTIWWAVLAVVFVVIVPIVVGLLHRTLRAARDIRGYLADMLAAGVGIAENTGSIPALQDTIAVGAGMVETAGRLKEHSGTIAELLSQRALGGSS